MAAKMEEFGHVSIRVHVLITEHVYAQSALLELHALLVYIVYFIL